MDEAHEDLCGLRTPQAFRDVIYPRRDNDGDIINQGRESHLTGNTGRAQIMLGKDFIDKPVQLSANTMAPVRTSKFLPVKAQVFQVPEDKEGAASFNSNNGNVKFFTSKPACG